MQKRKSLLMKLLVLLTAVCCTLAIAFGVVGCADKPKDSVVIQKAEIVNGELVITYTDGNVVIAGSVNDQDSLDANCDHAGATMHTLRWANCNEEGLALKVCTKCAGYGVVKTEKDADVHGSYELKPVDGDMQLVFTPYATTDDVEILTCSGVTYSYGKCEKCQKVTAGENAATHKHIDPTTGESLFERVPGIHKDGNVCMDGEYVIYKCSYCHEVGNGQNGGDLPGYDQPVGHHTADSTWVVDGQPTEDTEGLIKGICTVCKEMSTITLPKLSDTTVYAKDVPTCADAIGVDKVQTVYSFIAEDGYYGFKAEFKFDTEVFHVVKYNGKDYNFAKGETYDYEKVVDLIGNGITWDGATPAACNVPALAIINECAECHAPIVISAKGPHDYKAVTDADGNKVYTAATCIKAKFYVEKCACGASREILEGEPNGHVWEKVGDAVKNTNGTVTINVDCKNCDETDTITGTLNTEKSTTATCKKAATNVYDYTINGEAKTIEIVDGDPVGHKVVGKDAYFFGQADKTYNYEDIAEYLDKEITWDGATPADCNVPALAILSKCEFCEAPVVISAKGPHNFKDVVDAEGEKIYTEATCEEGRYYTQACDCTGCTETKKIYEGQGPLGHVWVQDGDAIENDNGTVTIKVICSNGCGGKDEITGTEIDHKDADCVNDEYTKYEYVINGETKTITIVGELAKGHSEILPVLTWEIVVNDVTYVCKGQICDRCELLIVASREVKN